MDDLFLTGGDEVEISKVKGDLKLKYEMKELGEIKKYLNLQFEFLLQGISIHQANYIFQRLNDANMQDCKPTQT